MNPRISVVIITRNEEQKIEACLQSILWADEIIIVDDMSLDRTRDICAKYPVKIFVREMTDFALQRNFGMQQAAGEWIFSIDADERVTPELQVEIAAVVKNSRLDAYFIATKNIMLGRWMRHGGWYPERHIRLFRKDKASWDGAVHEKIRLNKKSSAGFLKQPLIHESHPDISEFSRMLNFYASFEAQNTPVEQIKNTLFFMVFRPVYIFIKRYFLLLGFLDLQ